MSPHLQNMVPLLSIVSVVLFFHQFVDVNDFKRDVKDIRSVGSTNCEKLSSFFLSQCQRLS